MADKVVSKMVEVLIIVGERKNSVRDCRIL